MSDHAATWDQVVRHFLQMKPEDRVFYNWGTAIDNSIWDVNGETYINGIVLTIDYDYEVGWLIEIVDKTNSVVNYGVIVSWPAPDAIGRGGRGHDSMIFDKRVGTFFDRQIDSLEVCEWAVPVIHGLLEGKGQW